MKIKTEIKKETIVVDKEVKSFILNEREALFLRDLLGGATEERAFGHIQVGHNLGKWKKTESDEVYMRIFRVLDGEFNKND